MLKLHFLAFGLLAIAIALIATGCNQPSKHPNQINDLDGTTYDTMTVAHGAMMSLRTQIATNYKQYAPQFNEAAASYSTAFTVYSQFRTNVNSSASPSQAIAALTVSIVALENSIQEQWNTPAAVTSQARAKAMAMRTKAAQQHISISDVLTELEIAATIAQAVPAASPYANLASMVIESASQGLAAYNAAAGQPIDLSTIQPIPAI
jgi:hypothetical protein